MHKLPVMATAGNAYRFLYRELGTIVRLTWLPLLVAVIVQYFAARADVAAIRAAIESGGSLQTVGQTGSLVWQGLNFLAATLGVAVAAVALHRVILFGERHEGRYVHVSFGKVETLFAILPVALYLGFFAIVFSLGLVAALARSLFLALLVGSAAVALFLLIIRLSVIFPITVVERRYDFRQAWSLTRGNGWRLIGLWIVVQVPIWIVMAIVLYVMGGWPAPALLQGDAPKAVFERMEAWLLPGTAFGFLAFVLHTALGVALLSYAYKALRGYAPDDAVSRSS